MSVLGKRPPRLNRFLGPRAAAYNDDRQGRGLWKDEQAAFEALIAQSDGGAVLDAPVGAARFAQAYAARGLTLTALDRSPDMLAQAIKAAPDGIMPVLGVADALPFRDKAFDLVVCVRFLGGVVSRATAEGSLREFRRVCRGQLLVNLSTRWDEAPDLDLPPADRALKASLKRDQAHAWFQQHGFRVARDDVYFQEPERQLDKRAFVLIPQD